MRTREKSKAQLLKEVQELKAQVAKWEHDHRVAKGEWNRQMDQMNLLLDKERKDRAEEVERLTGEMNDMKLLYTKSEERHHVAGSELKEALLAQALAAGTLAKHMGVKVRQDSWSTPY